MAIRVLVVDDDPQVRQVITVALEREGHEVEVAVNGREALDKLESDGFDLLVLDIVMPEQDGIEVIMELKRRGGAIMVLAISSPGNSVFLEIARGLGATKILPKPFGVKELCGAVDELVATRG